VNDRLIVRGAREHNLKNVSLEGKLTSEHDVYDFNKDKRGWFGETLTWVGRNSPGKTYNTYILGDKPVTETGSIPGCTP
jgi:hypothetical protein